MTLRTASTLVVALALIAACGSSGETTPNFSGVGVDSGTSSSSSGGSSGGSSGSSSGSSGDDAGDASDETGDDSGDDGSAEGGGACGTCMTDSDCQSSCPPVMGGGTNCCDTGSNVCYATTQSSCPSASDAGKE